MAAPDGRSTMNHQPSSGTERREVLPRFLFDVFVRLLPCASIVTSGKILDGDVPHAPRAELEERHAIHAVMARA